MGKNNQLVVYVVVAHMLLTMMSMIIESRKRKRHAHAPVGEISYVPIHKRDRMRIDYLNYKV
jgi:hypothetical protein